MASGATDGSAWVSASQADEAPQPPQPPKPDEDPRHFPAAAVSGSRVVASPVSQNPGRSSGE